MLKLIYILYHLGLTNEKIVQKTVQKWKNSSAVSHIIVISHIKLLRTGNVVKMRPQF
jgi:precorrin-6B methylase 1